MAGRARSTGPEEELINKLRRIEALHARAGSDGERLRPWRRGQSWRRRPAATASPTTISHGFTHPCRRHWRPRRAAERGGELRTQHHTIGTV